MDLAHYTARIRRISPSSHKGQNGKVMVIGGSELFHAASRWALDVVSSMVDMVFYSSVPENNTLIAEAKKNFWSGIVIPRGDIEKYIHEADVVLIGRGMTRQTTDNRLQTIEKYDKPSKLEWEHDTEKIVNYLLSKYPHKKWVIDAGALQMVDPSLLNEYCIITPHEQEFLALMKKAALWWYHNRGEHGSDSDGREHVHVYVEGAGLGHTFYDSDKCSPEDAQNLLWDEKRHKAWLYRYLQEEESGDPESKWSLGKIYADLTDASALLFGSTVLRKGVIDEIGKIDLSTRIYPHNNDQRELVSGGNAGMTKGGTGDVLAGLVAGLYVYSDDPFAAAVVASTVNKQAGDALYQEFGPFFTTNQLVEQVQKKTKEILSY